MKRIIIVVVIFALIFSTLGCSAFMEGFEEGFNRALEEQNEVPQENNQADALPESTPEPTPEPVATPEPESIGEQTNVESELIGAWNWMGMPYYVFEADGTGTMTGMDFIANKSWIYWSTNQGIITIWTPTEYYYEISGNQLNLTSTLVDGLTFNYTSTGATDGLVGAWSFMGLPYYVFEADGAGTMFGTDIRWSASQGVVTIWIAAEYYYEVSGDQLNLVSTLLDGITFTYSRG